MDGKNLEIVLEKPKSVTLSDGSKINLKPLPVMEGLDFLDLATGFRANITSDLMNKENRANVLAVVGMLLKRSDYKGKWQEDERIGLQTLQDLVDAGIQANLPQLKTPTVK